MTDEQPPNTQPTRRKFKFMPRKMIVYDRKTGTFACYMSGTLYQHAGSYHEGETLLNDLMYKILVNPEAYPQFVTLEPEEPTQERMVL